MRPTLSSACAALALLVCIAPASPAITLDGRLDPEYGAPIVVQTSQTWLPDATAGRVAATNGGELDAAYAYIGYNTLHLFIAGNLWCEGNPVDPGTRYSALHVYIDTHAGGQNTLSGFPGYYFVGPSNGLTFDSGYAPGFWFGCAGLLEDPYVPTSAYTLYAFASSLPTSTGGTVIPLGTTGAGGPGTLAGGTNPHGIQVAVDNSNVGGVTYGCDASSGYGVTTGIEWAIPLAALGDPVDCLDVSVLLTWYGTGLTNQVLGPLPSGTCIGGPGTGVNFAAIAGNQFFTVCPASVPVRTSTWGAIKSMHH
jgi:hypothetical protein